MPDEVMSIGSFSMLTGLSVTSLRHYDEIGLLQPAQVDGQTNYRRYAPSQVEVGRRIRLMRAAQLSTAQISILLVSDERVAQDLLAKHRAALTERATHVQSMLDHLVHPDDRITGPMTSAEGFRLVAINIGVDSDDALQAAREFWSQVLGTDLEDWGAGSHQVVLGQGDHIGFLNIRVRSADEPHRGHISAFGLGVPGLDEAHQRAIAAGGTEQYPPTDGEHMPRHSLLVDPVGNRVVLWENGS